MTKELPKDSKECSIPGMFITKDARVFKQLKTGYKEMKIRTSKNGEKSFYNSAEKSYVSLTSVYADAFIANPEKKPLAFIKDASKPLSEDNVVWATNEERIDYWKLHTKRVCKCCGKEVESDLAGEMCKGCFARLRSAKPDNAEIRRFQDRVAATGFDPEKNRFSGRQRDILELYCSGESLSRIANIVGCDLQTIKACISSAKTARVLEKMSSDSVTEIGYKSLADVLPASKVESEQEPEQEKEQEPGQEPVCIKEAIWIVNRNRLSEPRIQREIPEFSAGYKEWIAHQTYNSVEDAKSGNEYFTEPYSQREISEFSEGYKEWIAQQTKTTNGAGVEEFDGRETHRAVSRRKSTKTRWCEHRTPFVPAMEPEPQVARVCAVPKAADSEEIASSKEYDKDRLALNLEPIEMSSTQEEPVQTSSVQEEPIQMQEVERIDESIVQMLKTYRSLGTGISFANYCKVYWLACKYTKVCPRFLTEQVIKYVEKHYVVMSVSNINTLLHLGMEVLHGR